MRQTAAGEHGQFLSAHERVKSVDRGNTGLNELGRVVARSRVHCRSVDVHVLFRDQRWTAVLRLAHAVKYASEHVGRNVELDGMAEESCFAVGDSQALRPLEQLHHGLVAVDFEHAAAADRSVRLFDLDELVILDALDVLDQHQRADDLGNGSIFFTHQNCPPSISAVICSVISFMIALNSASASFSGTYLSLPIRSRTGSVRSALNDAS